MVSCGTPGCSQPDFHIGPCDSTDAGAPRKRRQAEAYKAGSSTELTRELREAQNQRKQAKPASSSNPKKPDPFAFPDADPFEFTGEDEGRPIQKLVRQKQSKTSSSAGQPSSSAAGVAEAELELHLSAKSKTGYLHVALAGSRFRAEVRNEHLGNYGTAVEAAAAVARHLHLQATAAAAEGEEEIEYVIECVLEQRKQGRKTEYLVKWKGWEHVKDITWEPAAALKDTAALEEYLQPRLDIMGNRWSLGDASVSVWPADSDEAMTLATPAPPTALACDFGGYVWLLAGAKLYRLDPRGPGYTDDGMAGRECPGEAPTGCVGAYHGDLSSHQVWVEVALPESPLALQPPRASDHVVVTMPEAGPREVALGADGAVRLARPAAEDPAGWRALPCLLPCANHDIASAVVGEHVYVVGGALWWRGFPAREHMFDEVWRMDVRNRERREAWEVVAQLPGKIAFAGLASLGGLLYIFGGCRNRNGVPNDRIDERQLWVYDPAAATLAAGPSMRVARQECGGACLGGRVYAFGWDRSCESFGPGELAWRAEAECPVVLGGGDGMAGQFSCTVLEGRAYVAGPFGLLSFSPDEGWATLPAPPTPGGCPLVAAHRGEVFVMSGFFYDPAPGKMCELTRDVHSYDPATRQWSERPPLPSCEAWGAGASVGNTLYCIGGSKFSRDARTFCFDNRVFAIDI